MTISAARVINLIGVLVLLVLAAEGGYYWGFNRGLKTAPSVSLPTSQPVLNDTRMDTSDIQTLINVMGLLFKPQVIKHLDGVPRESVWWSNWTISVGGKLTFLGDKDISMELSPSQKVKSWFLPPIVHYQVYNETSGLTSDIPRQEIRSGDTVGFNVSFDTLTGEAKEAWITKSIK